MFYLRTMYLRIKSIVLQKEPFIVAYIEKHELVAHKQRNETWFHLPANIKNRTF
jgi:hypothetical protein